MCCKSIFPNVLNEEENSQVDILEIPIKSKKNVHYHEVFEHLISRKEYLVPLGIYRKVDGEYIFILNPDKDFILIVKINFKNLKTNYYLFFLIL